jgi:WD40 repeat protein
MLAPHHTNVFTTNFLTGTRFISGGNDATVQAIEILPDGRVTATRYCNHHVRKVHSSFVVDSNTFVTCSHDRTVRLFDVRAPFRNQEMVNLPVLHDTDMQYDGRMKLEHDLRRFRLRPQGNGGGSISAIPSDQIDDGSLLLNLRESQLYQIDVHPIDRKRFLTCGNDSTIRLFDMRMIHRGDFAPVGFSMLRRYPERNGVTGAAFDPTGDRIAATVIGGHIHVLDADAFVDLSTIEEPPPMPPIHLADLITDHGELDFGPIRQRLPVHGWPVVGEVANLSRHSSNETIKTVNWLGEFVVTGSDSGFVYFYDVPTAEVVHILAGHESNVNVVTVHQEKRLLATSGIDSYSILWEPQMVAGQDIAQAAKAAAEIQRENDRPVTFSCPLM